MSEEDDLSKEFLIETTEGLDALDQDLLALEKDPSSKDSLEDAFRRIHTVKGNCSIFGFAKLENLAHAGEDLLDQLRKGRISMDRDIASLLLALVDSIREIMVAIDKTSGDGDKDYAELIASLGAASKGGSKKSEAPAAVKEEAPAPKPSPEPAPEPAPAPAAKPEDSASVESLFTRLGGKNAVELVVSGLYERVLRDESLRSFFLDSDLKALKCGMGRFLASLMGGPEKYEGFDMKVAHKHLKIEARHFEKVGEHLQSTMKALGISEALAGEVFTLITPLVQDIVNSAPKEEETMDKTPTPAPQDAEPAPVETSEAAPAASSESVADTTIRVNVSLLDKLMNLVGELVLARNQIIQVASSKEDSVLAATTQRLNMITTELQEGVMKTRMQPIGNILAKFPRLVRDLGITCSKKVRLEMEGQDTELDRTLIEAIKDPLTHLVRNAVDHGLESPEVRLAKGKPEEGRVFIRSYHEGGRVNIEISDDGGGIDTDKVRTKAVQKGLLSADAASRMGERELLSIIFQPGFSTAEKVTNISGRGVGMDVVKNNIERIGGAIDIQSSVGEGTVIKIKIPLTLAIIPALVITSGGSRYAIPQIHLLELVRLEGDGQKGGIEMIHGAPVYRLRGNLLPIIYLDKELGRSHGTSAESGEATNIVVLQADDRQFGLVVDQVLDTEEIVVKPLNKLLKSVSAFAGATIMGDGKVSLILDVLGIAQKAHVISEDRKRAALETAQNEAKADKDGSTQWLVVELAEGHVAALSLGAVARLEEFKRQSLEQAAGRTVIQYRGKILPIVDLCDALYPGVGSNADNGEMQVVVVGNKEDGGSLGLAVKRIVDILDDTVASRQDSEARFIEGSGVLNKQVMDLVDIDSIVGEYAWKSSKEPVGAGK